MNDTLVEQHTDLDLMAADAAANTDAEFLPWVYRPGMGFVFDFGDPQCFGGLNTPSIASAQPLAAGVSLTNLVMDANSAGTPGTISGIMAVASVAVLAGGSGYAVGDTITSAGGVGSASAILSVSAVNAGAVTAATVKTQGAYSNFPTVLTQSATSGSGTGATFTPTALARGKPAIVGTAGTVTGGLMSGGTAQIGALSSDFDPPTLGWTHWLFSAWFATPVANPSASLGIAGKSYQSAASAIYDFSLNTNGAVRCHSNGVLTGADITGFTAGQMYQWALEVNAGAWTIYRNNVVLASGTGAATAVGASASYPEIGTLTAYTGAFTGKIGRVSLENLTASGVTGAFAVNDDWTNNHLRLTGS